MGRDMFLEESIMRNSEAEMEFQNDDEKSKILAIYEAEGQKAHKYDSKTIRNFLLQKNLNSEVNLFYVCTPFVKLW